jgi:hypothetical protein
MKFRTDVVRQPASSPRFKQSKKNVVPNVGTKLPILAAQKSQRVIMFTLAKARNHSFYLMFAMAVLLLSLYPERGDLRWMIFIFFSVSVVLVRHLT